MVFGHHIQPAPEVGHLIFINIPDDLIENLLHGIFGGLSIFEVLHANAK